MTNGSAATTASADSIYLRDKLTQLFPDELPREAPSLDLMNRSNAESLEHIVNAVCSTMLKPEHFEAFMADGGYFYRNIDLIDGNFYNGLARDQMVEMLQAQHALLSSVSSFNLLFKEGWRPKPSGKPGLYTRIATELLNLGAAGWMAVELGAALYGHNLPLPTSAAMAALGGVGAYAMMDIVTSRLSTTIIERLRSNTNSRLNGPYPQPILDAFDTLYQRLTELKGKVDIKVPLETAGKMDKYAGNFDEAKAREDYKNAPLEAREDAIRKDRKVHYDIQASFRRALHLYRGLDRQLETLERIRHYMADDTSAYTFLH